MERLTKLKGNYVCWNGNQDYSTRDRYTKVLDRLAAYEDTGLTPEQIQSLAADKDEQAGRLMKMDYLLRRTLPILAVTNDQQELIEQINALLGGKEDV
jgi:hypothetical protein